MQKWMIWLLLGLHACASAPPTAPTTADTAQIISDQPPRAAKRDYLVRSAHGDRNDPYYWLRDDTRKNPEMLAYLNAENAWSDRHFKRLEPLKEQLFNEMKARIKEDDASVPTLQHGYWYYERFLPNQQYPVMARRKATMQAPEEILLDGNERARGQSFYQLGGAEVSSNGQYLAVAEDTVGRRQFTLRIRDLKTGNWLPEKFENVDRAIVFGNDQRSLFFVEKDPETLLPFRVRRHQIGADPASASVVHVETDNTFYTTIYKTKSERYLIIYLASTLSSEVRFIDADHPQQAPRVFLPREADHEYYVDELDGRFYIRSNWQASNFRILRAPVAADSDKSQWQEVLAHRDDAFVEEFELFRDRIAIGERSGGLRKIRIQPLDGSRDYLLSADEPSYTMALAATPDLDSGKLRYTYTSLTTPVTTYELDLASGQRSQLKQEPVLGSFSRENYQSEFIFVPARDGARIPVSIVYRKDWVRNGTHPLLQAAYGSYGASRDPNFSASRLSLLDRGFAYALAHVRGGQEMGRAWYENGKLLKKQNTFNDFVDVSDYLHKHEYVAPDQLYAIGGSAGGLLMGAIANQAPDRYRGIIAAVPFVDVVTTMLDESIPLTTGEFDEWGNPKKAEYYQYMLSYSPYDNVRAQDYPAMYVSTGLWDSQVQYFEPAKWVARLRELKTDSNPLLLRTEMTAGHGGKSGRFEQLREVAEEFAFLLDLAGRH